MTTRNTWPEPDAVLSRLEQIRLAPLRAHPDVWVDDERPTYRFRDEVPVRIVVNAAPVTGCDQRESRVYPGGEIDLTAPAKGYPAPGPALNVYPRAQRSLIGRALRRLKGTH